MNFKSIFQYSVLSCAVLLSGCGQPSRNATETAQKNLIPIQNAFSIHQLSDDSGVMQNSLSFGVQKYQVSIKRAGMNQAFLLQGSWINQEVVPSFNGMRSKVVFFKERGSQLAMVESAHNHVIHSDLPSNIVLATFPIISSNADEIVFDWAKGMSSIFVSSDWYASDFQGPFYSGDTVALPISSSYIEDAQFSENGTLVIRQVSQITNSDFRGYQLKSNVETRYYLRPYATNNAFKPTKTKGVDRMGFFEANPQIINGMDTTYVSKFDSSKPITFAVSANTPADYKQAIKDGVLYWNKAFGSEVVKVVDAAEGLSAPNADHNIVQWVNWDDAGYAYADAQMDPFTGEILHAQIYLTSAFAFYGKKLAAADLITYKDVNVSELIKNKNLNLKKEDFKRGNLKKFIFKDAKKHPRIGLKGFESSVLCMRDETTQLKQNLLSLIQKGATEQQLLKIAQDYVREVVAHEVGHTLGLRHNFAGSVAASFKPSERDEIYKNYLTQGHAGDDVIATSSVMDYQMFQESTLSGDRIASNAMAFDYDHKAIQTLYRGQNYMNKDIPLFCTDSHVYWYADCAPFDSGKSPIASVLQEFKNRQRDLPSMIASTFVMLKTDPRYSDISFEDLFLGILEVFFLNDPIVSMLFLSDPDLSPYLQVIRKFDSINQWNESEVIKANSDFYAKELEAHGGLSGLFPNFPAGYRKKLVNQVKQLIADSEFTTAVSSGTKPFAFSSDEQARINSIISHSFAGMEALGIAEEFYLIWDVKDWLPKQSGELVKILRSKMNDYVTQTSGAAVEGYSWFTKDGWMTFSPFSMPAFSYELSSRLYASKRLGVSAESTSNQLYSTILSGLNGYTPTEDQVALLPEDAARWVTENRAVYNSILASFRKAEVSPPVSIDTGAAN